MTEEIMQRFRQLNEELQKCCELSLKQPLKDKQMVVMTDASFNAAGYALMTEDNPDQKIQSKRKTYAPVAFGSKVFTPAQIKYSIYAKEFLAIHYAFMEFGQYCGDVRYQ